MSELISELDAAGMHPPVGPVDATHGILLYLARHHKCSLLGDYRCLRVAG